MGLICAHVPHCFISIPPRLARLAPTHKNRVRAGCAASNTSGAKINGDRRRCCPFYAEFWRLCCVLTPRPHSFTNFLSFTFQGSSEVSRADIFRSCKIKRPEPFGPALQSPDDQVSLEGLPIRLVAKLHAHQRFKRRAIAVRGFPQPFDCSDVAQGLQSRSVFRSVVRSEVKPS